MTEPATYVERQPTVTAMQWDGTKDASVWIIPVFNGRARGTEDGGIEIDDAVSTYTLDQGVWVVKDEAGNVYWVTDDYFTRRYALGS